MANSAGAPRTPSITGTLAARSLAELLVHMRTKRLTGRLVLRTSDGRGGAIDLWRAQIVRVRTSPPVADLVATATESEQANRNLDELFAMPGATAFAFYDEKPSAAEPPFTLDPIAAVWRALRDGPPSDALRASLAPLTTKALRIVNEALIARVAFSADEKRLCQSLVDRPMTLAEMRASFATIPPERIERLAHLLVLTSCVELVRASTVSLPAATAFGSRAMSEEAVVAALKASKRALTPNTLPTDTDPLKKP